MLGGAAKVALRTAVARTDGATLGRSFLRRGCSSASWHVLSEKRLSCRLISRRRARRFTIVMTPRAAFFVWALATLSTDSAGGVRPTPLAGRESLKLRPQVSTESRLGDWMAEDAETLYPRTLHELVLPGTHDSGAYWLTKQLMPDSNFPPPWAAAAIAAAERLGIPVDEVITKWALTQTQNVAQQLESGYRYLDIRAGWNKTHWCVHHAKVGVPISTVFAELKQFLDTHKGEFVLAQVSHLDGSPSETETHQLKQIITTSLSGVFLPVATDTHGNASFAAFNRTLGDMVSNNHRALVVFGDGDYEFVNDVSDDNKFLWPPQLLHNGWADTDDPSTLLKFAHQETISFANGNGRSNSSNQLSKLSWTLTAQVGTVLESVLPGRPHSLRALNKKAKPLLAPFVETATQLHCRTSNVLSVDFGEASDAVNAARAMNRIEVGRKCELVSDVAMT